jgi:hypothetical protein
VIIYSKYCGGSFIHAVQTEIYNYQVGWVAKPNTTISSDDLVDLTKLPNQQLQKY